jgi:cell wall assembly regulator SMI1
VVSPTIQAWELLEAQIQERLPDVFANLTKGAPEEDFKRLEETLGFAIPSELREFYQRHNGHRTIEDIAYSFDTRETKYGESKDDYLYTDYFLFSLLFLPVYLPDSEDSDIGSSSVVDVIHRGGPALLEDQMTMDFRGPVRKVPWHSKWVPICASPEEDLIVVDYDPAPKGTAGQIVFCKYTEAKVEVIADSLATFLKMQAEDLKKGLTKGEKETDE